MDNNYCSGFVLVIRFLKNGKYDLNEDSYYYWIDTEVENKCNLKIGHQLEFIEKPNTTQVRKIGRIENKTFFYSRATAEAVFLTKIQDIPEFEIKGEWHYPLFYKIVLYDEAESMYKFFEKGRVIAAKEASEFWEGCKYYDDNKKILATPNTNKEQVKEEYVIKIRFLDSSTNNYLNTTLQSLCRIDKELIEKYDLTIGDEIIRLDAFGNDLDDTKARVVDIIKINKINIFLSKIWNLRVVKKWIPSIKYDKIEYNEDCSKYILFKNNKMIAGYSPEDFWDLCEQKEDTTENKFMNHDISMQYLDSLLAKDRIVLKNKNDNISIIKEDNMNKNVFENLFKDMKFGKLETTKIKYSFNGIAFATKDGGYVVLNDDMTFTNVADMVINMPVFAMPVPCEQITKGDIIVHNNEYVIVKEITNSEVKVIKPLEKEVTSIVPETSIFGFNFYTKIINIFDSIRDTASAENPFGEFLPFMLMNNDSKNSNIMNMFMMSTFCGEKLDIKNPMMLYMLFSNNENIDPMMFYFMNSMKDSKSKIKETK